MPVYEYKCKKCKHEFEAFLFASEKIPEEGCPKCGSKKLEKQFSLFGMSGTSSKGGGSSCSSCSGGSCSSCSH